jgi:ADP-ribose pyrophosphatase YjhB (NUDIX family)
VVVGALPVWEDQILICRRAIEPALGKWTLPAGYLENGETLAECAIRETQEEAGARIVALKPYAVLNIPHIDQIYFMFRAEMAAGIFTPGAESLEAKLIMPEEIPWPDLAFTSIAEVLTMYCNDINSGQFDFRMVDIPPHK